MRTLEGISRQTFYVVGGTLRGDAPSYVEREADRKLFHSLLEQEVCYVLTARQMGKSSLMVRTAARLREAGASVVVLDLTGLGQNLTAEQWYNGLSDRVGQQLHMENEIEDAWLEGESLSPLQRWMRILREVVLPNRSGNVVIFIDEIDAVRSLPFTTDEFFAGIRELYNRRSEESDLSRLTFCMLGVATPTDLIRDTRTTPFNIGRRIELTDFTEKEASPLARGLGREYHTGLQLLKRVLYWTGGHPYLTQRLCQAIALDEEANSTKAVDRICRDLYLSHRARERDDNLLFVRERILRSEVETAALLTLYSKIRANQRVRDDETNPWTTVLRLSGITTVDRGQLKVRNRVYYHVFDETWVISNLPGAELRRQHAAYRKGLKRAATIFVPILLLGVVIGWESLYRAKTTLDLPKSRLEPPPFWMSGRLRGSEQAEVGTLLVKTGEGNVTVFINEQQYGRTAKQGELMIPALLPGEYKVRVEKTGYQRVIQQARIIKNSETQLTFKLQAQIINGQITIENALPETSARLDGKDVGTTTETGSLLISAAPGEHTIELTKDGYSSKQIKERLILGTLLVVDGKLTPDQEFQEWAALDNSKDSGALQSFLRKYPNGRFSEKARNRAEQLDWDAVNNRNDPGALDALYLFQQRYPKGQFEKAAQDKVQRLQEEQMEWITASRSNDQEVVEAFLDKYPNSPYTEQAQTKLQEITRRKDQQAIENLLRQYEQAYDRLDIDALSALWPTWPANAKRATQNRFNEAQSVSLILKVESGQPEIVGGRATVKGKKLLTWTKKDQSQSSAEYPFKIELAKQGERWLILRGP